MKDHSILYNSPMVRAILSGQKTQTRRVVNPQPKNGWQIETPPVFGRITSPHSKRGKFGVFIRRGVGTDFPEIDLIPCPYGQPGDRLWVRETWAKNEGSAGGFCYRADHSGACAYEAHDLAKGLVTHKVSKWKPSIHMPRAASRITLEITGVRVEKLKDIAEEDARAEGCKAACPTMDESYAPIYTYREGYAQLWESINGAGSWEANPWVWTIDFRRIQPLPGIDAAQSAI